MHYSPNIAHHLIKKFEGLWKEIMSWMDKRANPLGILRIWACRFRLMKLWAGGPVSLGSIAIELRLSCLSGGDFILLHYSRARSWRVRFLFFLSILILGPFLLLFSVMVTWLKWGEFQFLLTIQNCWVDDMSICLLRQRVELRLLNSFSPHP